MREKAILEAIASELQTGVIALDKGAKVLFANPFFKKSFSIKRDITGKNLRDALGENDFVLAVEAALKGKAKKTDAGLTEITEAGRSFKLRMVPVKVPVKARKDLNLIVFLRDITEEKLVEAVKKDFVANVSHELRTPLASIKGCAETLLDSGVDDKETSKEFLRIIDKNSTRMSRLIEDLLILSRIESQQMPLSLEVLDLGEIASSIADGFDKQARDKGVKFTTKISRPLPRVTADRVRVEQVVVNLLDNAIKYTPSGGTVELSVAAASGKVQVDVKDTGIGIPKADMPRIFERFYRVDKARSREMGGTGLGLAIVKHIIQSLNGKVWVESAPMKGSTFSFALKSAK
ncbi:MAG: ATP-binding protein [Deltaproteobacteria bacterium]|nr:ATP-binding protein [Deltaproteobacteria bacterium]